MKLSLALLMIVFLSLAVIACGNPPDAQRESRSNIDSNSALSEVALEVPTVF